MPSKDRIVVTAACRSGTRYMCDLLNTLGISAMHEGAFSEDGYRGYFSGGVDFSCWYPHHVAEARRTGFSCRLFHQTRDPLESISSNAAHWEHLLRDVFTEAGGRNLRDQRDHVLYPRLLLYHDPVMKAAAYYVFQHDAIQEQAPLGRYKVEDPKTAPFLRDVDPSALEAAIAKVPKNVNAFPGYVDRAKYKVCYGDIQCERIRDRVIEIRAEYGYVST